MLQDFQNIEYAEEDEKRLQPHMSGWMKLYTYTEPMQDTVASLKTLGQILAIELANEEPRKIVLTRIHMRYASMRARLEYNKLIKKAKR